MYIEWISVDDRLPKNGETVIDCYLENTVQHVFHGYRIEHHQENGEMDCWWENDYGSIHHVTHWTPFPRPPK